MPCDSYAAKTQYGHGRIANRITQVYHQNIADYIIDEQWAMHLKTLACVSRTYNIFNTKTKNYDQRSETVWYVSNGKLTAQQAAHYILNHWGIENTNHYVRDVTLCEDESRIRNNSTNMAILRSTTLNILRKQKIENIKGELYQNSLQWKQLYTYTHLI
jgi:predicted transposase YbfD/YdcC